VGREGPNHPLIKSRTSASLRTNRRGGNRGSKNILKTKPQRAQQVKKKEGEEIDLKKETMYFKISIKRRWKNADGKGKKGRRD